MKPLKLEVIFGSKDSLSPALKHMIGGSKAAASALEQTTKQIAKLKLDQKNIDSFRKFRTELDQTTAEINKHKQVISDLKKQSDLGPLTKQQTQELGKSQKALERLNQTYGQQSQKLTETVQKMNQAGIAVESLTQDESNLKDKILQTTMAYTKQKQAIDRINAAQQQYQQTQAKLQSVKDVAGKGMMLAGAGMAATAVPVKLAVDFESAMADVKKVVDFGDQPTVAAAGLKAMSDEVVRMSTYLPMAAKDIATIVAAGGQSGIAKGELTRFAEDAVKMGVAFDTTAEEAGQSMAEMRTAFRLSQNEVVTLADKINYLGNNTPAAAKSIMQIVQRIGPLGEVGGYASGSIAALGATLKGMGVQEEIAATGIKNMMLALVSGEAATKSQKAVWKSLGLDYVQVAKDMQVNAEETTMKVLQSISKMDKYEQASILKQLFGSESLSAIAPLLTNMEALQKNLDMVGDSTKYAGSMNAEYDARAATTANNLLLLKNNLSAIGIVIGNILLPPLNAFTDKARGILEHVQEWSRANPTLASTLVKLAVGGIAVVGGISAIALTIATVLGPLAFLKMSLVSLSGGIGIFSGLLKALVLPIKMIGTAFLWVGKAMLANPMVLAITAIVAVVAGAAYLIYKNWEPIKGFFTGVWNAIKNAFQTGVSFIKSIIVGIDSVFASNPILNVLMPFIGIPRLIIANWSVISGFFTNLWSAVLAIVSSSVSTVVGMVTTGFNAAASFTNSIWNSIKNIVTAAWQGLCNIFIAISPLPYITSAFNSVFAFLAGLYERMRSIGSNIIQGLIDGVKSGFGKLKDLWSTVNSYMPDFMRKRMDIRSPSRVMAGIGGHIMGGLQVGLQEGFPSLKNKFSAVADVFSSKNSDLGQVNIAPALSKIKSKSTQQFGSNRKEVVVQGDTISIQIHASPGQNIQQLQHMIESVLNKREQEKLSRIRSSFLDQE